MGRAQRPANRPLIDTVELEMTDGALILTPHAMVPETIAKHGTLIIRAENAEDPFPLVVATLLRINPSNSFTPVRAFTPKL